MVAKNCPVCGKGQGPEIPDRPGEHYSEILAVEIWGVYDGTLFYMCPYCHHKWHRFKPEDGRLYEQACRFVEDGNWPVRSGDAEQQS